MKAPAYTTVRSRRGSLVHAVLESGTGALVCERRGSQWRIVDRPVNCTRCLERLARVA